MTKLAKIIKLIFNIIQYVKNTLVDFFIGPPRFLLKELLSGSARLTVASYINDTIG